MKKSVLLFVSLALFVSLCAAQSPFAGGAGTVGSPYQIRTAVELDSVRHYMNDHFILMNDIDLPTSGYPIWLPLGKRETTEPSNSFTAFNGTFDGRGHVISGVNMIYSGNYVGFFAVVGGEIRNLGVKGTVNHNGSAGGLLAGYLGQTTIAIIENCFAEGTVIQAGDAVPVNNGQAALLCGVQTKVNSIIRNCYVAGSVSTVSIYAGGIAGRIMNAGGMLMNCYSAANVKGTDYVGGITGQIYGDNIHYTYATGKIEGNSSIGGITGNVVANSTTTGHVAINSSISAASMPLGRVTGGLAGTIAEVYGLRGMDIKLNGATYTPNSNIYDKDGGHVDLADLQSPDFYENDLGWDFDTAWKMSDGCDFPILSWQPACSNSNSLPSINEDGNATAFFQGNLLHIQDIKAPSNVKVYTLTGQLVKKEENVIGNMVFILPNTGIYIIKLDSKNKNQAIKVINQ